MLALAMGGVLAAAGPRPARSHRSHWSSLDALAAAAVAQGVTPGVQASVMKEGALAYSKAYGSANLETSTPLVPSSILRIGSLTKQFTAAAILLLQEDGKLSVDDRLSRFIPEIGPAREISLRQMLSHVSGIAIGPSSGPIERRGTEVGEFDAAAMVATINARHPVLRTPPGTHWEYNNLAYRLLGVVAERASGTAIRNLYKERLFDPAGLVRTSVDDIGEVVLGRASGYERVAGAPPRFRNAAPISLSWPGGAGAMRSTTDDLCRWHKLLLQGGLLRPESLAAMLTPVRLNDGSLPMARPPDAGEEVPLRPLQYGFGIRLETEGGRQIVTHTGAIEGFVAELTSYPHERVSVAVLMNCGRGAQRPLANEDAVGSLIREGARIALG